MNEITIVDLENEQKYLKEVIETKISQNKFYR